MPVPSEKKVVLFLVEGSTDEAALIPPFRKLLENEGTVKAQRFCCDVTTVKLHRGNATFRIGENSRESVRNLIQERLERRPGYAVGDLAKIIHVVDLDGAFVDESAIVQDSSCRQIAYSCSDIRTRDKAGVERRNREKTRELNWLVATNCITIKRRRIPYRVFYVSRNLEHALMGIEESCDQERKEKLGVAFGERFGLLPEAFLRLLEKISAGKDYRETWRDVAKGLSSLQRGSNLDLVLEDWDS